MNPLGNVFCSRCNTRLLPTEMQLPEKPKPAEEAPVGVKGISLPTLPAAKDGALESEELPDWLLELTEQPLGKPAETPDVVAPAEELPDWLSGLVDDTAADAIDETADASAAESAPEDAPALSELPDWFSDLAPETATPEDAAPEETPASATPDWFADLLEDEAPGAAEIDVDTASSLAEEEALEELPDWLSELTPEEPTIAPVADALDMAPPPPVQEAAMPTETVSSLETAYSSPDFLPQPRAELPDWLLATATPVPSGEVPASQPLPEWLLKDAEEAAPGQEAGALPGRGQLPGWLLKGAEPGAAPAAPPMPVPPRPKPVEVQERVRPAAEAAPSPLPVGEPEEEPEEKSEPDWLADLYLEEEPELQAAPPVQETASSLPDWLQGVYEEEVEPQAAIPTAEPEEEATPDAGVPDWLADIYSAEEDESLASVFTAEPEKEAAPDAEAPEADAPEADVPDWLAGIMIEEPVPTEPEAPSEGEGAASGADVLAPDVPDWITGLAPEAPSAEEEQPAHPAAERPIFTEPVPEESQAGPSATPDWLKGVTALDEEADRAPAQPAFAPGEAVFDMPEDAEEEPALEAGEIPDWLEGLSPAAPSPIAEEAAFYERVSEDESLVRAEVPSWLQGLRPPGTGPLPPLPEVMAPGAEVPLPQEGGLVRAEIPDWVQQLRPVPSAEGEAGEKRVLEPAETEGPLAGLRGVLPVGAVVDMPADFVPAPPPAIPESIMTQAQLWQQLLEQPRSVQRPVAQHRARSGSGQLATRLIVTVILFAVTVLGLLWGDVPLSQALSRPHIEHFSKALDALEPGDTVIVAVEYGPAEAGEMAIQAQAVVQHLADQNARVMMVSTLPEGAGLTRSLLEPLALANRLPAGQTAYLPGSANGVAQFLSESAEAKMIIVLAGRAERLRWWMEQNNATQMLPIAVGVNAATAPLAMPYLETPPVKGWMAGLPDVVAYQEFRGLTSSILESQLDALMLTHWAALALLLFGLFYYLALGKRGAV